VERRRGSCAEESKAERERGDGPQGIETLTVPETTAGVRKLQRTSYRQARSMGECRISRQTLAQEANLRTDSRRRMRKIRLSGSIRGRRVGRSTTRASLLIWRLAGLGVNGSAFARGSLLLNRVV
jgi:hypothetical protein